MACSQLNPVTGLPLDAPEPARIATPPPQKAVATQPTPVLYAAVDDIKNLSDDDDEPPPPPFDFLAAAGELID